MLTVPDPSQLVRRHSFIDQHVMRRLWLGLMLADATEDALCVLSTLLKGEVHSSMNKKLSLEGIAQPRLTNTVPGG